MLWIYVILQTIQFLNTSNSHTTTLLWKYSVQTYIPVFHNYMKPGHHKDIPNKRLAFQNHCQKKWQTCLNSGNTLKNFRNYSRNSFYQPQLVSNYISVCAASFPAFLIIWLLLLLLWSNSRLVSWLTGNAQQKIGCQW